MFGIDDAALVLAISGLASTAGSLYTNNKNLEYQQNVNDTNWQIAAQNNATQIEMANTAHQREVADLKAAGLNPILSSGGSGASTPSLTSMRGDSAQIENPVNGVASSAKSLANYVSKQYQTNLEQARADVDATRLSNDISQRSLDLLDLQTDNQLMEEQVKKNALTDLTGMRWKNTGDGNKEIIYEDPQKASEASDLVRDGLRAGLLDDTNRNWRNNLSAVGGAVGDVSSLMGGASALMRATNSLRESRNFRNSQRSRP